MPPRYGQTELKDIRHKIIGMTQTDALSHHGSVRQAPSAERIVSAKHVPARRLKRGAMGVASSGCEAVFFESILRERECRTEQGISEKIGGGPPANSNIVRKKSRPARRPRRGSEKRTWRQVRPNTQSRGCEESTWKAANCLGLVFMQTEHVVVVGEAAVLRLGWLQYRRLKRRPTWLATVFNYPAPRMAGEVGWRQR